MHHCMHECTVPPKSHQSSQTGGQLSIRCINQITNKNLYLLTFWSETPLRPQAGPKEVLWI